MQESKILHIKDYIKIVNSANKELTKKEAFKDLLNRLYSDDDTMREVINTITRGAEKTVINIPRKDRVHRGMADTLYNKIIIEFENDLKVTLKHAREQLAGYLLGQFNSGEGYNFTLIASDFIEWKVFSPDLACIELLGTLTEDELILNEVQSATFILNENNCEEFYYWIDRFLFKEEKQKATLNRMEESFGYQSVTFLESYRELGKHFTELKKYGEVQVAFEQWRKFLSFAYGTFDGDESHFLIHTYLSIFAKMLAYSVVSNNDFIDDDKMKGIIDGSTFNGYNLRNFVDNDFFHWVKSDRNFKKLKKVFRLIAQEIAAYDFSEVDEDILKGVYQELIDLDTRHALGEYYTPDWLCERIVNEFEFKSHERLLDPACGSGSFLRAAVHRMRALNPTITVEEINNNIYGIDIHPLSVQIAKTTMLLALGKDIIKSKKPVHLNIILANTLLAPDGVESLFGTEFEMVIDKDKLILNSRVLEDFKLFDEALEVCDELAEQTMNAQVVKSEVFLNILQKRYNKESVNKFIAEQFYKIYLSFISVRERGRNGIWKFIIQNLYKPYFLSGSFDYVVGNPPWFTYSSIKNEEYQNELNHLAEKYFLKPDRAANFPHLEIAAIFLSHCSSYFLKNSGKLSFVVPRSFFNADHHDNTRSGKAEGFITERIWDLEDVTPLFRIPSAVLFVKRANNGVKRSLPKTGIQGLKFGGKLSTHNCNFITASHSLTESETLWFYSKQGRSSAFSSQQQKKEQTRVNPYINEFKQGATIVPRTFYFVELTQELPPDFDERVINIKTSDSIKPYAKKPWNLITFSDRIESRFLFRTAISKSILPFALYKPDLIVLPIIVENDEKGVEKISLLNSNELRNEGYLYAAKWFKQAENVWGIYRTEKNKVITLEDYLNWNHKLQSQKMNAPYLVLYNSSAKDANATIVKREEIDFRFLVESTTYVCYPTNLDEAYYLAAILNSNLANSLIKDFQAKGLFGPRHVHKKILGIYFPIFDLKNKLHLKLALLSKEAHAKTSSYLSNNPPGQELSPIHLGRLRTAIKNKLTNELTEIDTLVKKIIE